MPFHALVVLLMLLGLSDFAVRYLLFRRLKARHPAKYDAMDRPSVFVGRFSAAWAVIGFLVFRDHTLLKDSTTTRLADALLALRVSTVCAALALAILFAAAPPAA